MSQNINIMTSVPVTYKGLFKWSCKLFKKLGWIGLMKQQCIDNKSPQFILFYESKLKSYIKSVMALDCAINNKLETPALKENNLKRDDLLILKTQNEHLCTLVKVLLTPNTPNLDQAGGSKKKSATTKKK